MLLFLLVLGCGDKETSAERVDCESSADCDTGLLCWQEVSESGLLLASWCGECDQAEGWHDGRHTCAELE